MAGNGYFRAYVTRLEFAMARGFNPGESNIVRPAEVRLNDAPSTSHSRLGSIGAPRENAFPAALRHTTRVARLRWFMLWGVGGIVAVVAVVVGFQFLRFLPIDLRFAHIAMKGSRITIESPKLVGYRPDGRPYELRAKVGIQDMSTPDLFELEALDVRLDSGPDQAGAAEGGGRSLRLPRKTARIFPAAFESMTTRAMNYCSNRRSWTSRRAR